MFTRHELLTELIDELKTTRALIERVPEAQADWRPHEKSMSLGILTVHLRNLLYWGEVTVREREFNLAPPGGEPWQPPPFESVAATLKGFDDSAAALRRALESSSDEDLQATWTLKRGDQTMLAGPRNQMFRKWVINHLIHHRGQLSVYLRLQGVPLPAIYGPSADSPSMV